MNHAVASAFYGNFKLGILGGGQLGRMLIRETIKYNVDVCILDPDALAPCADLAHRFTVGDLQDYQTVYNFGKTVDLLTIEIEHVNTDALEQLEKEGLTIYPQPSKLKLIQDKGLQKQFYQLHGIATAPFELLANKRDLENQALSLPVVQKLRKGGYDGKGVQMIRTADDLAKAFDAPSIAEKWIPFEKELSVIVARNATGEVKAYPAVEMEFKPEANLVEFLMSPANISAELEKKAQALAVEVISKLELVGLLAVEMFLTTEGEILVNEIAPRPHNSGHQSFEGNHTSQFEQHLRAILNLPLGSTRITQPSIMLNLLGEEGYQGPAIYQGLQEVMAIEGVYVHLYGKKTTKPNRKMGHVTIVDDTLEGAKQKAFLVKQRLKVIA